jgi:hypothetical protein
MGIIVTENTSVEVIETETETQIVTVEEEPTVISVLSQGPQGPPSFADAPSDGKLYGRQNGAWVEIPT